MENNQDAPADGELAIIKKLLLERRKKCDEEIGEALKKYDCHFQIVGAGQDAKILVINNL